MTDEEYGEVLRQARDGVDLPFEIQTAKRCGYCGQLISPDPTDSESWVHTLSGDAQCIVDGVKLDGWAIPSRSQL